MNIQQLARADYLDIIFDGRNKSYGAFELRKNYPDRLKRSLGAVLAVTAIMISYPLFAGKDAHKGKGETADRIPVMTELHTLAEHKMPKPLVPARPQTTQASTVPTVTNPIPKIVPDELADNAPKPVDSLEGKAIGAVDSKGNGKIGLPASEDHFGTGGLQESVVPEKDSKPVTYSVVDQSPVFKGNLSDWLSSHLDYPDDAHSADFEGSVDVQFVVAEDGSISEVKVLNKLGHGLSDEAERVVKLMPRWKPGMLNGRPVRTLFHQQISFVLSN